MAPNYQSKMANPNTGGLDTMKLRTVMDSMEQSQRIVQQTHKNIRETQKHVVDNKAAIMKLPLELDEMKRDIRSKHIANEIAVAKHPYEIEKARLDNEEQQRRILNANYKAATTQSEADIVRNQIEAKQNLQQAQINTESTDGNWLSKLRDYNNGASWGEQQEIDRWIQRATMSDNANLQTEIAKYKKNKAAFMESQLYKKDPNLVNPNDIETAEAAHYASIINDPTSHPAAIAFANGGFERVNRDRQYRMETEAKIANDARIKTIIDETGVNADLAQRIAEQGTRAVRFGLDAKEMVNVIDKLESTINFSGQSFDEVWAMDEFAQYQNNTQLKDYIKNEFLIEKNNQIVKFIQDDIQAAKAFQLDDNISSTFNANQKRLQDYTAFGPEHVPISNEKLMLPPGGENFATTIFGPTGLRKKIIETSPFGNVVKKSIDYEINMLSEKYNNPGTPLEVKKELALALQQAITDKVYLLGGDRDLKDEFNAALKTHNLFGINIGIANPSKRAKEIVNTLGEHYRETNGLFKNPNSVDATLGAQNALANSFSTPVYVSEGKDVTRLYELTNDGYVNHISNLQKSLNLATSYSNDLMNNRSRFVPTKNSGTTTENMLPDPKGVTNETGIQVTPTL